MVDKKIQTIRIIYGVFGVSHLLFLLLGISFLGIDNGKPEYNSLTSIIYLSIALTISSYFVSHYKKKQVSLDKFFVYFLIDLGLLEAAHILAVASLTFGLPRNSYIGLFILNFISYLFVVPLIKKSSFINEKSA